jgi:hypothetical protein
MARSCDLLRRRRAEFLRQLGGIACGRPRGIAYGSAAKTCRLPVPSTAVARPSSIRWRVFDTAATTYTRTRWHTRRTETAKRPQRAQKWLRKANRTLTPRFLTVPRTQANAGENPRKRSAARDAVRACSWLFVEIGTAKRPQYGYCGPFRGPLGARANPSVIAGIARTERLRVEPGCDLDGGRPRRSHPCEGSIGRRAQNGGSCSSKAGMCRVSGKTAPISRTRYLPETWNWGHKAGGRKRPLRRVGR